MKPKAIDLRTESIRAALLAMYESHGGILSPAVVVDEARDPVSPLHDEFEWNDDEAAEQYRLAQAGMLIRRVRLSIVKVNPKTKRITATVTRQFQSRPSQRHAEGGYETVQDIMADEEKRAELLDQVLREMRAYRKRYAELTELQSVWSAIDEASDLLRPDVVGDRPQAPAA